MFHAIGKMGISEEIIELVKLLFHNASAMVHLNGSPWKHFKIERGAKQGCPMAPCLFLVVGEMLTHIIEKMVAKDRLRGIVMLGGGGG